MGLFESFIAYLSCAALVATMATHEQAVTTAVTYEQAATTAVTYEQASTSVDAEPEAVVTSAKESTEVEADSYGETTDEKSTIAAKNDILEVMTATPNPTGHLDELYVLKGEVSGESGVVLQNTEILPSAAENAATNLRIFHFNDMHANLVKYSSGGNTYSFAQMAKRVSVAADAAGNDEAILFVSAGDDHIGSLFDEMMGSAPSEFIKSAPYAAYSAGGVDFSVIGNHELDKQSGILKMALEQDAAFPVLSANIVGPMFDISYYPAALGVVKGLRVGFIGLTTPNGVSLHTASDKTLTAIDPMDALQQLVPALEPYCDVMILLCHNGFDGNTERYTLEFGDTKIAELVGELTDLPALIVGGHTHTVLNRDGLEDDNVFSGIPVVQAGQYGEFLGEVTMNLNTRPKEYNAKLHPTLAATSRDENAVLQTEKDYDVELQTKIIDPIKVEVDSKLEQVFAKTADDELVSNEITSTDRYIGECALSNFMNDALVSKSSEFADGKVDFAVFNATGIGGLPVGADITYADMYKLMPYADTIIIATLTGKDLQDIVNSNVVRLYREEDFTPFGGEMDPNAFHERGVINFSSGIRYTVLQGETPDKNVVKNLTLNGEKIEDVLDKEYKVLLSSYLGNGRGAWTGEEIGQGLPEGVIGYDLKSLAEDKGYDTGLVYRNSLIDYIRDVGIIDSSTGLVKDGRLTLE